MRNHRSRVGFGLLLAAVAWAQQPADQKQPEPGNRSRETSARQELKNDLEPKVKAEWEALKTRNKKTFGDLLAEDFKGIEDDGEGARNKLHAVNEVDHSNVYNYSMAFINAIPLASDAALVTYEVTMEFQPKATVRYKRIYITEIWLKRQGEWKLRHYQETRVK
jgi:hypothetical protein